MSQYVANVRDEVKLPVTLELVDDLDDPGDPENQLKLRFEVKGLENVGLEVTNRFLEVIITRADLVAEGETDPSDQRVGNAAKMFLEGSLVDSIVSATFTT